MVPDTGTVFQVGANLLAQKRSGISIVDFDDMTAMAVDSIVTANPTSNI